jgi:hypothetical protein
MKKTAGLLVLPFLVASSCGGSPSDQIESAVEPLLEASRAHQIHEVREAAASLLAFRSSNLIDHGGPVVPNLQLNLIFWGSGFESTTVSLYESFLQGLPASGYWTINHQYLRGAANTATFGAAFSDTSTPPATVTDADLQAEVHKVLSGGGLAYAANHLYYVITPKSVRVCAGSACSCTTFCGYHSSYVDPTFGQILYSTIPSAAACPTACGVFSSDATSPNGNVEADEGVSILAHEGEETMTDPLGSAWFDRRGNENGDKCAYRYGSTSIGGNGAPVNQSWGGHSWLVQMNWSNSISACAEFGPTH